MVRLSFQIKKIILVSFAIGFGFMQLAYGRQLPFDPKTEAIIEENKFLIQTKKNIYFIRDGKVLEPAHIDFKTLVFLNKRKGSDSFYLKDGSGVFYVGPNYVGRVFRALPQKFRLIKEPFWTDGEKVIRDGKLLIGANLRSFVVLDKKWDSKLQLFIEAEDELAYFAGNKRIKKNEKENVNLRTCKSAQDCIPVACRHSCGGCGGFDYDDIINKKFETEWYSDAGCYGFGSGPDVCCPSREVTCIASKCGTTNPKK